MILGQPLQQVEAMEKKYCTSRKMVFWVWFTQYQFAKTGEDRYHPI
jgi:hypothetical protein